MCFAFPSSRSRYPRAGRSATPIRPRVYGRFVHGFDVSTTVRSFPEHESLPSSLRRSVPPTIRHRYRPTAEGHRVSREKVRTLPSTFSLPLFEIGFRLTSSEWNPGRSVKVHTPPGTSGSTGLRETFQMPYGFAVDDSGAAAAYPAKLASTPTP